MVHRYIALHWLEVKIALMFAQIQKECDYTAPVYDQPKGSSKLSYMVWHVLYYTA